MKTVIIDDMELAIASLQADIEDYCPEIELVGTATGVIEGAKLLRKIEADIVFLDVEMQDGNGFDLLDIIGEHSFKVIFTTGSKEFAIRAFQYAALDYLLKPIDPDLLQQAIKKTASKPYITKSQKSILKSQFGGGSDTIALNTQEEIRVIRLTEIVRCESMDNYTRFFISDSSKVLVTKTLKDFERLLPSDKFVRVHQSHLVNIAQIKAYVKSEGGYLLMNNDDKVSVSVRKKPMVMDLLLAKNS